MKIYLDPGHNHSGADTGACGNGLKEQDITWLIAARTRDKLETAGLMVQMSRNSITDNVGSGTVRSSLSARTQAANRWGADLFVSIHCNAGGGHGTETYCFQGGISSGFKLAKKVQACLVETAGLTNRGVKINPSLAVLRGSDMPAVLIETGFIDNPQDAAVLGSETGQEKFAEAITQGICGYLLIDYIKEDLSMTQYEELKNALTDLTETVKILAVELENMKHPMIWNYIDENMPEWARPTIQKLADKGLLKGGENGLNLTEELMRLLVINDRAGLYGE